VPARHLAITGLPLLLATATQGGALTTTAAAATASAADDDDDDDDDADDTVPGADVHRLNKLATSLSTTTRIKARGDLVLSINRPI
jgi:hypothetical protein